MTSRGLNIQRLPAQVMEEMRKNEALAVFENEYTRLYETLYETHRSEKALSNQCTKLKVNRPIARKILPFRLSRFART